MIRTLFASMVLFFAFEKAYSQKVLELDDFIQISQYSNKNDFESFIKNYGYTLYESNLIQKVEYDELGFIKHTDLKKFKRLQEGDSLLFNKRNKIFKSGKKTIHYTNYLEFKQSNKKIKIVFSATSATMGYDFMEKIMEASINMGFERTNNDTIISETSTMINFVYEKSPYQLHCVTERKNNYSNDRQSGTEPLKYTLEFTRKIQ